MVIWIYKEGILINDNEPIINICNKHKISNKTIYKYKDIKLYKDYYFSTHILNKEELNNIFATQLDVINNKITNTTESSSNVNEEILNAINELRKENKELKEQYIELQNNNNKQFNELRKENNELKESINKLVNVGLSSSLNVTKIFNKIEDIFPSNISNILDNQIVKLSLSEDIISKNISDIQLSISNISWINDKNKNYVNELVNKAIRKINGLYKTHSTKEEAIQIYKNNSVIEIIFNTQIIKIFTNNTSIMFNRFNLRNGILVSM